MGDQQKEWDDEKFSSKSENYKYMTADEKQGGQTPNGNVYRHVLKPMAKDMPFFVGGLGVCLVILPFAVRHMKKHEILSDRLLDVSAALQVAAIGSLCFYMMRNTKRQLIDLGIDFDEIKKGENLYKQYEDKKAAKKTSENEAELIEGQ